MPGNWHVPFGKGPSEKDPNNGHLADGLLHHRNLVTARGPQGHEGLLRDEILV